MKKKSDIWKLLLTLYITFASCQLYWVFKKVELQTIWHTLDATKNEERRKRKEKVNLKERRRMPVKKIWNLREERHALWVWETACDASEWRDERVRMLFIYLFFIFFSCFGLVCIYGLKQPNFASTAGIFFQYKTKGVSVPVYWSVWYIPAIPAGTVQN